MRFVARIVRDFDQAGVQALVDKESHTEAAAPLLCHGFFGGRPRLRKTAGPRRALTQPATTENSRANFLNEAARTCRNVYSQAA